MNEIQERIFEHEQTPYSLFAQGDMVEIVGTYKMSNIGKFSQAELDDLNTLNDKDKPHILYVTENGKEIPIQEADLDFGRCSVGQHNKSKKQYKNNLKVTPFKIDGFVFDTKEQITTRYPASSVKPGQYIDVEFDWKPSMNRRKGLKCNGLVSIEPIFSKRMDLAMYPLDEYEN